MDIATNPSTMIITEEPIASNTPETLVLAHVLAVIPVFFDYSKPEVHNIVSTTAAHTVRFAGKMALEMKVGMNVTLAGTAASDGTYPVVSASVVGANTVVVLGGAAVATAGAVGTVSFTTGSVEQNDTGTQFGETYPFRRMTKVIIESHDGKRLELELQNITNQATWSLGTREALNTAMTDINALL